MEVFFTQRAVCVQMKVPEELVEGEAATELLDFQLYRPLIATDIAVNLLTISGQPVGSFSRKDEINLLQRGEWMPSRQID